MAKYQVFIDVPNNGDWDDLSVESIIVTAKDCAEARDKATELSTKEYDDFYVWEVSESDKLE